MKVNLSYDLTQRFNHFIFKLIIFLLSKINDSE